MTIQIRVMAAQGMREARRMEAQFQRTGAAARAAGMSAATGFGAAGVALTRWGSQVQWAGRQLQYNFTIPLAIAGGAAAKFALDNERQMVRVEKVYGDTAHGAEELRGEIEALSKAFVALSNHFGVNQAEVIDVAGDWAAAGASGIALAKSVKLTMETMILGEIEAAKATEALIAIQAQYGLTIDQLAESIDALNMIENETGITMAGLIDGMQRSAGAARTAGIDIRHLGALMAALVPAAGTASTAGNGLRTMVTRLLAPTQQAAELLDLMGLNIRDVGWQSLNGVQRLELLAETYQTLSDGQKAYVSTTVASRWQINRFEILMRDITNENGYYQKALNATADAQANFNQRQYELNKVLESNPQRLKQMWAILQNAMADIIQPFIPWIVFLAKEVARLVTQFSQMDPAIQKLVLGGLAFVAAFGMIARYVGVTGVLFGFLIRVFEHAAIGAAFLARGLWKIVAVPFKVIAAGFGTVAAGALGMYRTVTTAMFGLIGTAASATWTAFMAAFVRPAVAALTLGGRIALIPAMRSWFTAIGATIVAGATNLRLLWGKALVTIFAFGAFGGAILSRMNYIMFYALPGIIAGGWRVVSTAFLRGYVSLQASFMRLTAAGGGIILAMQRVMSVLYSAVWAGMWAIQGAFVRGWAAVRGAMVGAWAAMTAGVAALKAGGAAMVATARLIVLNIAAWFRALPALLMVSLRALPALMLVAGRQLLVAVRAIGPLLLRVVTGPIGLLITAVSMAFILFKDKIVEIWNNVIEAFSRNSANIANSFRPVVDFFHAAVKSIGDAFNALPRGVQNAIMAVVNFIKNAALQVYEWFGYLNPFKRHSPSLVESVTNGMRVIARQYQSIGNVTRLFADATRDLEAYKRLAASLDFDMWSDERADVAAMMPQGLGLFNALVGHLNQLNKLLNEQDQLVRAQQTVVKGWEDRVNAANEALDAQELILTRLRNELRTLTDAYQAHEDALDRYADAPITGMRKMSDAIFENELAQKRLRLEIMKLEDAGQSVEDLRSRLAAMQGDIEKLRGDANDLRAAGAGSDVLGPIQAEIAAMEAQYRALEQGVGASPINELQKQLEQLQREGEILDLENAIQFDPLMRQIDQLVEGMNEMPFDEIVAGIKREQAAMDALQPSIDAATQAHDAQVAIVERMQAARDELQRSYDVEYSHLRTLRDEYSQTADAIRDIEQALRMVTAAAQASGRATSGRGGAGGMSGIAADFLAAGAGDFADVGGFEKIGREGGWEDQGDLIEEWTRQLAEETALGLGSFDMWAPIREKWDAFKGWWNDNVTPAWQGFMSGLGEVWSSLSEGLNFQGIGEGLGNAASGITGFWNDTALPFIKSLGDLFGPQLEEIWDRIVEAVGPVWEMLRDEFDKWGPTIESLKTFFVGLWNNVLKPLAAFIGGVLIAAFSTLFSTIGNIIGPVIRFIGDAISSVLQFIRGTIDFITALFRGDFTAAMDGISTMIGAVWSLIVSTFQGAWDLIYGIVSGIVEGIVDFFTWLYDVLVGNSIIPDLVNAIVGWFKNLWDRAVALVKGLVADVVKFFQDLWNGVTEKVEGIRKSVSDKFEEVKRLVLTTLANLLIEAVRWWENIRSGIWNKLVEIVNNARAKWDEIKQSVIDRVTSLRDTAQTIFDTIRDKFMGAFEAVRDKISGVMTSITSHIKTGINAAIRVVNSLISGLNKVAEVLPGLDWSISAIPLLAKGGAIPSRGVGGGFKTASPRAIVGEGNPAHPEFVIPTDPAYRNRATQLFSELASRLGVHTDDPKYGVGGWMENLGRGIKNAIGSGADLARQSAEWLKDAAQGAVSTIFRPARDLAQRGIDGMTWQFGKRTTQAGLDQVWGWVTGADSAYREASKEAYGSWRKPLNVYSVTSEYGMRTHPITGQRRLHAGIDLGAGTGTNIFAAGAGQLSRAVMNGGLGNYMRIDHGNSVASVYGHMSQFVKPNGWVAAGEIIGKVGSTGASTGPHLHFEIRSGANPLNPRGYMAERGVPLAQGGIVRRRAGGILAQIGEGRHDEAVLPLPSDWRNGMGSRIATMTVQRLAVVGSIEGTSLQPTQHVENNTYNFYGDLEFPNIRSGEDADDFIRNLKDMAGA